jgi:hypothetical protein
MNDILGKNVTNAEDMYNTDINRPQSPSNQRTTEIEAEVKIEDFINEVNAAVVQSDSPRTTSTDDPINPKLQEATSKIDKLQGENEDLMAQIQVQVLLDEEKTEKHGNELAELFQKMEILENQRQQLEKDQKQLREEEERLRKIKGTIRSINYENVESQLMENYLSPNYSLLLNCLKNITTKTDQKSIDNVPQIVFGKHQTKYTITVTGFQAHHDQFKIILQRIQSLMKLTQSAKEYYQRYLYRIIRSLMTTVSQVQPKTRYWILYKNIFSINIKDKTKELVTTFETFIEQQTKILCQKSISNELDRPWIEIRKFTNQFIEDHPFINQIEQIKHQTLDQFIQQNISFQRIKTDKKPTDQSALTAQQMIQKITNLFQTNEEYNGHQLKHLQLIPPLLQRIIIYYCCFALQLPLFESAKDLLERIQNNTVTTITTTTGSGKQFHLFYLYIAYFR